MQKTHIKTPEKGRFKLLAKQLQQTFPDMQNLRVREIKVDKAQKKVSCVISYPNVAALSVERRNALRAVVLQNLPQGYRSDVQFVNDKFSERSFASLLLDYTKKNFPLFATLKQDKVAVKLQQEHIVAQISVDNFTLRNMQIANYVQIVSDFFAAYTSYKVEIVLVEGKKVEVGQADVDNQEKLVQLAINRELLKPQRFFNITDVSPWFGKQIDARPMYISDIRNVMDSCVVCGKISQKEIRAAKNNSVLKICKFNLTDDSGATIPCVMFVHFKIEDVQTLRQTMDKTDAEVQTIAQKQKLSNDKKMKKLAFLADGMEVVVRGKVVYSNFSQQLELQPYDICLCRIQPLRQQPKFQRKAAANYMLVQPQPVEEYRQMSLMQLEEKPSVLQGTHLVVLFVNTTGFNITKDQIFAICAVRLVNGHAREKFFTLIHPLSEVQSGLKEANITLKQLNLSPTLTEIVPDLFKFVEGATLVGENLSALLDMFNYYAAPYGYNFANPTRTATQTLAQAFENSTVDARPVYSQLEEVAKALKLPQPTANCHDKAMTVAKSLSYLASHAR